MNEHIQIQAGQGITINNPKPINKFSFRVENKWLIEISEGKGIVFNKEEFPNLTSDDFAKEFCDILERQVIVKFDRRVNDE